MVTLLIVGVASILASAYGGWKLGRKHEQILMSDFLDSVRDRMRKEKKT